MKDASGSEPIRPTNVLGGAFDSLWHAQSATAPQRRKSNRRNGAGQSLRITRLELSNWRNFRRAELDLVDRAFFVGPNASGKSNLLDTLRFLRDVVAVGGGFEEAVMRRGGVSSLRSLAARKNPDIKLAIDLGYGSQPPEWRYELSFNQTNQRRPRLKGERVLHRGEVKLDRPDSDDKEDQARLSQTYLEQVNANQNFRAIADFLRDTRYRHIVPQLIREPDRSPGRIDDPFGGDFIEQIARTPVQTRNARLGRIEKSLKSVVPQLEDLKLDQDDGGAWHLTARYRHWRPGAGRQTESEFSDGTLRLLGLLWVVQEGSGPLLLEEPELSLHPEVVKYIPPMLTRVQTHRRRQVLVSTQSADLLHDPGIGFDEVFLLTPDPEGTVIEPASSSREIHALLDGGLSMGEAVMPRTRPPDAHQLSFFPGK